MNIQFMFRDRPKPISNRVAARYSKDGTQVHIYSRVLWEALKKARAPVPPKKEYTRQKRPNMIGTLFKKGS